MHALIKAKKRLRLLSINHYNYTPTAIIVKFPSERISCFTINTNIYHLCLEAFAVLGLNDY